MRYILYSRVSTNMQLVEHQIKACVDHVNSLLKQGDEVIHFDEPDTSSRIPMDKRTKLKQMLDFVQPGDTVMVYKLDRLARDGEELVHIYRSKLIKKGVKIISLYEPHIDNMNIHIYAFMAEAERAAISSRTKIGLNTKRANKEKIGSCLFGYKTDDTKLQTRQHVHSTGKPYLLIQDENESGAIAVMTDLINEGYSYGEIADKLMEMGYKNRKGNPIHKMTVYRVIQRLQLQHPVPMQILDEVPMASAVG